MIVAHQKAVSENSFFFRQSKQSVSDSYGFKSACQEVNGVNIHLRLAEFLYLGI